MLLETIRVKWLLLFAGLALGISACFGDIEAMNDEFNCTLIGCENSLKLGVVHSDGSTFVDGKYMISVAAVSQSQKSFECTMQLGQMSCELEEPLFLAESNPNGTELVFRFSGTWWMGSIQAVLELDGVLLGDETLSAETSTLQPNGPNCEPTCYQGATTMTLY